MNDLEVGLCVVVVGNPVDGIRLIGPFHNGPEAIAWAALSDHGDWWIAPIEEAKRDND